MTPQEILEGNKLLAEFIGYEKSSEDKDFIFYKHPDGKGIVIQSQHDCKVFHTHELMEIKGFIFHRSWDWLMPVVEKIAKLDISSENEIGSSRQYSVVSSSIGMITIESVWLACVEFAKWYNQNKVITAKHCPNCNETEQPCACMRNICHKCGKPVGNITFTICDDCWDIEFPSKP